MMKARGIKHEYRDKNKIWCPVNEKYTTLLSWAEIDGTPFDLFCNLCGHQCNVMKGDHYY